MSKLVQRTMVMSLVVRLTDEPLILKVSAMRRTLAVVFALAFFAGCSDRLQPGDRVVLVSPIDSETVMLLESPEHRSPDDRIQAIERLTGHGSTSEAVPTGTRAVIVLDAAADKSPYRSVRVKVTDSPFTGIIGSVKRTQVRPE